MSHRIAQWIIQHRWWVILANLLLVAGLAYGVKGLHFSINYEYFFGPDNPELQAYDKIKNQYTNTDNLVLIVAPKQGQVFSQDNLQLVQTLTKKAWQLEFVNRVDSITNFQHSYAVGDELIVESLLEEGNKNTDNTSDIIDPKTLQKIKQIALSEPALVDFLQAKDGKATAVVATFNLPNKSPDEIRQIITQAKDIIHELEAQYPQIEIKPIGLTMLSYTYGQASRQDITRLTPLMFSFILLLVAMMTGSWIGTLVSLLCIVLTNISAFGVFGWLGIPITTVTAVAPTIIMAIVVAHCVHLIETFRQQWQMPSHQQPQQQNKNTALVNSLAINLMPVAITSLTTLIGFLCMNFNDVPPYRDLGNLVAAAVIVAFTLSMGLLPALLSVLPVKPRKVKEQTNRLEGLAQWVMKKRKGILVLSLALVAAFTVLIPNNVMNEKFVEQFDQSFQFRQDSDFFTDNISGVYSIEYSIRSKSDVTNALSQPEFLQTVDAFTQWLREDKRIRHVLSISDTFKRLNKNMHGDDANWYQLPDNRELSAQYLLLYELSLPYGLDLNNQVNMDKDATRVVVRIDDMSSAELLQLEKEINLWWQQYADDLDVTGASTTLMFTHIVERAVQSMVSGTALAFALIALVLIMSLRSLRLGLISLVPNLVPIIAGLGIWALIDAQVGMSFAIVVVLTLGIIVDDTVHFLSKYQYAKKQLHLSTEEALVSTFNSVGKALIITTIALVCGFLILSLSGFSRNADMGLMAAITITIALLVDLVLLPALIMVMDKNAQTIQDNTHNLNAGESL